MRAVVYRTTYQGFVLSRHRIQLKASVMLAVHAARNLLSAVRRIPLRRSSGPAILTIVAAAVAAISAVIALTWPTSGASLARASARRSQAAGQSSEELTAAASLYDARRLRSVTLAAQSRAARKEFVAAERLAARRSIAERRAAQRAAVRWAAERRAAAARAAARQAAQRRAARERAAQPSGSPQQIASAMLADYGWEQGQFGCLVSLWTQESGWNPSAMNASSGAYGIPQALPGSKMASAGADWQTNPATQIRWGLGYIQQLYGSPCGAWAHELANNWY